MKKLGLFVALVLACVMVVAAPSEAVKSKVPMPDQYEVVVLSEDADVSESIRLLANEWDGTWNFPRSKTILVVEKMDLPSGRVEIIYAWGPAQYGPRSRWERLTADLTFFGSSVLLEFELEGARHIFELDLEKKQLKGTRVSANHRAKITMNIR